MRRKDSVLSDIAYTLGMIVGGFIILCVEIAAWIMVVAGGIWVARYFGWL